MTEAQLAALRARASRSFTVDYAGLRGEQQREEEDEVSAAIKVLSAFGGLIATLIFIGVLFLSGFYASPTACLYLGTALIGGALYLGRDRRVAFVATSLVSAYLLGVCLLLFGLAEYLSLSGLALPVAVVAVTTLIATRNYFLVFVATVSLPACLVYLNFVERGALGLAPPVLLPAVALLLLQWYEYRFLADRRLRPLRAGLAVSLLLGLALFRWSDYVGLLTLRPDDVLLTAGCYLLCLTTLYRALGWRWTIVIGLAIAPLLLLPLLLGSLYLLLLSFHHHYFVGTGLGVLGLLYFTAQYYYDLRWDLLDKSIVLMVSGALLLGVYAIVNHRIKALP